MEISQLHQLYLLSKGISTDTRNILPGSIFFALKGTNFDANTFASEAIKKGAEYAVIDNKEFAVSEKHFFVEDVLTTLQDLAKYHRRFLNIPVIALTGSNGKTTTKELINAVLSTKYRTTATKGNLNNHIGVPLTLLSMTKNTEIGIVEMGANHPGEIAFLCKIAEPDFGYITNFGKAHLEGFGSVEGVKKAKSELYDFIKQKNGLLFLNLDDDTQKLQGDYNRTYTFSNEQPANINYQSKKIDPFVELTFEGWNLQTQLIGKYNIPNIVAALMIGRYFNVSADAIAKALKDYTPGNNRSQIINVNSNKIILDAYNANPTSIQAALESFGSSSTSNKIIILGDMFEMGASAKEEHQNIVNILCKMQFEKAYLIGKNFFETENKDSRIEKHESLSNLKEFFSLDKITGKLVLIKGSRGMALEKILE